MAAGKLDIIIEQGATFQLHYFVKVDGVITGAVPLTPAQALLLPAFDLTGFAVVAQVRESPESPTPLLTMECEVVSPAVDGEIILGIAAEETALLPAGIYRWDCFIISESTGPVRLLSGRATLVHTSTR